MSNPHQKQPTRSPRRAVGDEFSRTPRLREGMKVIRCNPVAARESTSIGDESRFLGRRLCNIAHIEFPVNRIKSHLAAICARSKSCTRTSASLTLAGDAASVMTQRGARRWVAMCNSRTPVATSSRPEQQRHDLGPRPPTRTCLTDSERTSPMAKTPGLLTTRTAMTAATSSLLRTLRRRSPN